MKVWDRLQTFRREHETYTAYSIGCVITWALIWAILAVTATNETRSRVFLIFAGRRVGWLSATIAQAGYPPPKKRLFKRDTADPDIAGGRSPNARGLPNRRRGLV